MKLQWELITDAVERVAYVQDYEGFISHWHSFHRYHRYLLVRRRRALIWLCGMQAAAAVDTILAS
jgi:hypothetical protein